MSRSRSSLPLLAVPAVIAATAFAAAQLQAGVGMAVALAGSLGWVAINLKRSAKHG